MFKWVYVYVCISLPDNSAFISFDDITGPAFYTRQMLAKNCRYQIPMILESPVLRRLFYATNDGFLGTCTWKNKKKKLQIIRKGNNIVPGMRQEQNQAKSIEKQYSREFWSQKTTLWLRQQPWIVNILWRPQAKFFHLLILVTFKTLMIKLMMM